MTIRADKSEILEPIIEWVAVAMIYLQPQRPLVPDCTLPTFCASLLDPALTQRPTKNLRGLPLTIQPI